MHGQNGAVMMDKEKNSIPLLRYLHKLEHKWMQIFLSQLALRIGSCTTWQNRATDHIVYKQVALKARVMACFVRTWKVFWLIHGCCDQPKESFPLNCHCLRKLPDLAEKPPNLYLTEIWCLCKEGHCAIHGLEQWQGENHPVLSTKEGWSHFPASFPLQISRYGLCAKDLSPPQTGHRTVMLHECCTVHLLEKTQLCIAVSELTVMISALSMQHQVSVWDPSHLITAHGNLSPSHTRPGR